MNVSPLMHRLVYFASDAWDEWKHSPGVNLLALGTLATTLFLAGLVMLVMSNLEQRLNAQRENVQVQVYLVDGIANPELQALRREAATLPGVARVEHVDKTEALRRYRQWAESKTELLEELQSNPMPASLEVFLEPGPDAEPRGEAVVAHLAGRAGVDEVRFDRDWLRRLEALLNLARIGGAALALVVFAAVVFVMASVLRLAVYARRHEIDIMLLVGATPAFVRGPFLVAGLAQGLVASTLALLLVEAARRGILAYARSGALALVDLVLARPLPLQPSWLLVGVGLAVSVASAFFAVRPGLKTFV